MGGLIATVSGISGAAPTVSAPTGIVAKSGKLSPRLAALSSQGSFTASRAQLKALSLPSSGVGSMELRPDGRVLVELRVSSTAPTAVAHLRTLGAQVVNVSTTYATVTAAVLPSALNALAADPSVLYANEVLAPQIGRLAAVRHSAGPTPSACAPIVSEGDSLMNVAAARADNNLDGTGQTIGILSDSFDTDASAPTHASDDVAAGELPGVGNPCGRTNPVVVQADSSANDPIDEGRAMAQLAHGLAPGADLAFATANNGELDMASQIANLRNVNHASVIVDDVSYIDEPFFQDGPIANAAKAATAAGVPYFSAAGNSNVIVGGNNVSSYEAPALRLAECPAEVEAIESTDGCHNFDTTGGTDTGDDITVAPGGEFGVDLQWAQAWGAVHSDYDIFIVNAAGTVVGGSASDNIRSQKPYEFAGVQNNTASPATFHIVIAQYGGGATPRFKFVLMGAEGVTGVEYNASTGGDIVGPSIFGHNGAATVGSTAAVPFDNSNASEDYSSRGPVTLYFQPTPSTTALVAPQVVQQPAFAATDGVQTSYFGELDSGTWRFYGTSAAAPQAAAIGALLQEKDPAITPAQLMSTLASTARTVTTNGSADAVGGGYLDADAALAAVTALPGAPTGVAATAGNAQATVSWTSAATNPNFPLTGYAITPIVGGVPQTARPASPSATSQTITGLTNGVSYTFTIAASDGNGAGPSSQPTVAMTVGAPGAPGSVSAVPGDNQAIVKWSPPTVTNGQPITEYTVNAFAGGSFIATHTFNSTATTQTFTGLADSTYDTFTVAAVNANGTGPASAPSSVIVIGTPPAPTVQAVAPIDGGLTITWRAPNITGEKPIDGYVVSVYRDGTTLILTDQETFRSTGTTFTSGLTNGTAYAFTILATNDWGDGPPSPLTALVVAGSPTAPRTPTAKTGNAAATVSWKAPASANGSAVTGYVVTPYLAGVAQAPRVFAGAATTRKVSGLANGNRYTFRVAARNARGTGLSSGVTAAVTIGLPAAPTGVTAKAGHKSATVHWTAPGNNGGAITRYIVTPYKNGVAQAAQSFAGNATTRTIKGLPTGQHYAFRVTAVNARGAGPISAASKTVTIT